MTKEEAYKAAIDGKRIRPVISNYGFEYLYFDFSTNAMFVKWNTGMIEQVHGDCWKGIEWEIVYDYVDFNTAFKAWDKDRKSIKSDYTEKVFTPYVGTSIDVFSASEIRGKWIILEDE